jgi:hypothetical protein
VSDGEAGFAQQPVGEVAEHTAEEQTEHHGPQP